MDKKTIRKKYIAQRELLSKEAIQSKSEAIANRLLLLPIWNATYYSLFLSIANKKEIDTEYILPLLQGHDKEICLPKMVSETEIWHYLLTDNSKIVLNSWGIPEPQNGLRVPEDQIEVVFIPLLAFDMEGNRIGYGKGFYDRFLTKCKPETKKIGLSFFKAEENIVPFGLTDIKLDYCITPETTYKF